MLHTELEYENAMNFFWTDSRVVLCYINNEARRFHTFVANRVQQIRERTSPDQWHYVATDQNPADHASRGLTVSQLIASHWFEGPSFLWERELNFTDSEVHSELGVGDPEVKAVVLSTDIKPEQPDILERLARISTWPKMIKAVTRLRLVARRNKQRDTVVQERKDSELFILQQVQKQAFSKEFQSLAHKKPVMTTSEIYDLDPHLDTAGLLRVGGRLRKANLAESVVHPVILPRKSPITRAIAQHLHQRTNHQGRGITQNAIRAEGFWILGGSKVVADLVRSCVNCRRLRRPQEEQKMADLPEARVNKSAPFTHVGMDCFGPFTVRRSRTEIKRYGLIFTCLYSRGIHLEMLDDMSTDACINSLRCFIALRGAVSQIRCDRGSNFVGACNEFKAAANEINTQRMEAYLAEQQCEFLFNAPHSSHAGGVWERQIRTVRSVLRATIDLCPGRLTDSDLRTLFYEAMAIVNSCPLTPANRTDPHTEVLTPNHLLTMKSTIPAPPPGQFVKEDMFTRRAWRRVQYLAQQFWSSWKKEYMLSLQQRKKWGTPRRNLRVGDIVLLSDVNTPRMKWPLAIVTSAKLDTDGLVRRVHVRIGTANLDKKGRPQKEASELERPIQKLILLLECAKPEDSE